MSKSLFQALVIAGAMHSF